MSIDSPSLYTKTTTPPISDAQLLQPKYKAVPVKKTEDNLQQLFIGKTCNFIITEYGNVPVWLSYAGLGMITSFRKRHNNASPSYTANQFIPFSIFSNAFVGVPR